VITPLRLGIIGMGGYAGMHHQTVLQLEEKGHARLVCTCDPRLASFEAEQQSWRLASRGVRLFEDHASMLAACGRELDVLVVPTPIPLHAEMHRAGVDAGISVYLEKPPTLDFVELEEMIAHDRSALKATVVGFNFIIEKARLALKSRLLSGEFGSLQEIQLIGRWPRPTSYFERNGWAGCLLGPDGRIILDSCLGNAMAHFVHNTLFWAGSNGLMSWATPERVRAELYRVHAIQGADTFFVRADLVGGVRLRIALSHACGESSAPTETVICSQAIVRYSVGQGVTITWKDGRTERISFLPFDALIENHLAYYRYIRGETDRPATTLADARPFVALNDLAHVSSGTIETLSGPGILSQRNEQDQKDYLIINSLEFAQTQFMNGGVWPSERGWKRSAPAQEVGLADLARFHDVIRAMAGG